VLLRAVDRLPGYLALSAGLKPGTPSDGADR
jgi:hypothetical protein